MDRETDLIFKYGHLPFDFKDWLETFDFNSHNPVLTFDFGEHIPNEGKLIIPLDTLKNDFSKQIFKYLDEELCIDNAEAFILLYGPAGYETEGHVTGWHMDSHKGYMRRNGLNFSDEEKYENIVRYWIPLQDRAFGQFFEITLDPMDRYAKCVTVDKWKAGDVFRVFPKYAHLATNLGPLERKVIWLTGTKK